MTIKTVSCLLLVLSTAPAQNTPAESSAAPAPDSLLPYPSRSPGKAVLLSFLIPAGGQIYTRNYWKVPLIAPAELALGYLTYREYSAARTALNHNDTSGYIRHRDRGTTFLFFTGAVIAFSMADAYVSAQLFGFNEQMRLSLSPDRLGVLIAIGRRTSPAPPRRPCFRS